MHDVIVVGAGPGGSATAHFLAKQGVDVMLLDKAQFPREKTCGDGLTPRALDVLQEMGILPELTSSGQRIEHIELYGPSGKKIDLPIPSADGALPYMLVLSRLILDERLHQRALESGAQFHGGFHVGMIHTQERYVIVEGTHNGRAMKAQGRIAVLAVGANTRLLRDLGILKTLPAVILAARAYYSNVDAPADRAQAHFADVPLPGYGWLFPTPKGGANIGVGFWTHGHRRDRPATAAKAFHTFRQGQLLAHPLRHAERISPLKGYPIRTDFKRAPTFGPRMLLVGEAAGLVSPLTGEGIDFALESGRIAAAHLLDMFAVGDFSPAQHAAYDQRLRAHFQRLFHFLERIRNCYFNPLLLNRFLQVASRQDELSSLLVNILLGHQDAADAVSAATLRKVLLGF